MMPRDRGAALAPAPLRHGAPLRIDLKLVADMIAPGSRVLDIGCGDGTLLGYLADAKRVDGRGIELSMDGVHACVSQGLSVIQGDADTDLVNYPTHAFDYAVLGQTLQATRNPRQVLQHLVRIGRHAVVSFPNFGYWRVRLALGVRGTMPVTDHLGFAWWETPNIHFCTISDFDHLCRDNGIIIEHRVILGRRSESTAWTSRLHPNLFGEQAIFLLRHA
ncbi:MAG: methionine biosynthesis protein MetW [Azospirillaceae bacterium]|nr:methionine biosynthesis protein MetW [Azospirillaceae bacterium]